VVAVGGPDVAKKVGGVEVAVIAEEFSVAATAEHEVGVKFATEFVFGFFDDAGEVGQVAQGIAEGGEVGGGDFVV